jgi:hypothetical protein
MKAHETYCEKYYVCVNNVWAVLSSCAPGTHFDPVNDQCDFIANLNRQDCISTPVDNECVDGEYFEGPFCEEYYKCVNGKKVLLECPYFRKFDIETHECKIRNQVSCSCVTKYPDACSDGDLLKDDLKCSQFKHCVLGEWVKKHCGTSYYDHDLGHCNLKENVLPKRPECANSDDTHDSDAIEASDCTYGSGDISDADKFPTIAQFNTFNDDKISHVRFVVHQFTPRFDCTQDWFAAPHPFECDRYIQCRTGGTNAWDKDEIIGCPPGQRFHASQWGGQCLDSEPCNAYCGDERKRHVPFSFLEVIDSCCSCPNEDTLVNIEDMDDHDGDQFTWCHKGKETRVYCCEGLVINPILKRCE